MAELRHLRYFVAVAEELNFSRAARRLRMAQPPLSAAIRQLEAELGTELFRRSSREVALTEAGRVLLDGARRTLAEAERALSATRRAGAGELGSLRIGFSWSARFETLPAVGRAFRARRPDVELLTEEMWNARMIEAIQSGAIDLAIALSAQISDGVTYTPIRSERVIAILSSNNARASDRAVPLDALSAHEFVLFPREYAPRLYDKLVGFCRSAGFEPRIRRESFHAGWDLGLMGDDHAVALAPESVSRGLPAGVLAVALADSSERLETHALSAPDHPSPALAAFLGVAAGVFAPAARS
jgi:LysR family transcriptional regulator, benzoate and cis,cis-muconate-responsive activator of ben and cat genes